jgi:hypothetical protein
MYTRYDPNVAGRVMMKSISQNGNSMAEFRYKGGESPADNNQEEEENFPAF